MKITYLILAHQYPNQLLRLIDRLDDEGVNFFIHLDKKMDSKEYREIVQLLKSYSNVHLIKRHVCYWGGFGIVQATFQGIKELIESKIEFDFLALMSGQDYPIKTKQHIKNFLIKMKGASFIELNPFPVEKWQEHHNGGWDRTKFWHFRTKKRYVIFPEKNMFNRRGYNIIWNAIVTLFPIKRSFPKSLHPYGGAQFWGLDKRHVQYVYDFVKSNPSFVRFFKFVNVPDELFFHTIIGNMKDQGVIHKDTLHFLEWDRPGAVLVSTDMGSLQKTDYLFARKFDNTIDANVLDLIDKQLLFK